MPRKNTRTRTQTEREKAFKIFFLKIMQINFYISYQTMRLLLLLRFVFKLYVLRGAKKKSFDQKQDTLNIFLNKNRTFSPFTYTAQCIHSLPLCCCPPFSQREQEGRRKWEKTKRKKKKKIHVHDDLILTIHDEIVFNNEPFIIVMLRFRELIYKCVHP